MSKLYYVQCKNRGFTGRRSGKIDDGSPKGMTVELVFVKGQAGPVTKEQADQFIKHFGPQFTAVETDISAPGAPAAKPDPAGKKPENPDPAADGEKGSDGDGEKSDPEEGKSKGGLFGKMGKKS